MRKRLAIAVVAAVIVVLAQKPRPTGSGTAGASLVAGTDYAKPSISDTYTNIAATSGGAVDTGRIGIPTTGGYDFARWNGSAWQWFSRGILNTIPPDVSSGWTAINSSTETFTSTDGYLRLDIPANATDSARARVRTATVSPPYDFRVRMSMKIGEVNYAYAGLVLRQSSNGKLYTLGPGNGVVQHIEAIYWINPTTVGGGRGSFVWTTGGDMWLRVVDDTTNRIVYTSHDGKNWDIHLPATARTTDLTADQVGVFADSRNSITVSASFYSFSVQ
jgi:hypothetical protein